MNLVGWGIALIVLGFLVTFSNLFGFLAGVPLLWVGIVLIAVGVVMGIAHMLSGRDDRRRIAGRGPNV